MKGWAAGTTQKEEFLIIGFQRGTNLPDFVSNSYWTHSKSCMAVTSPKRSFFIQSIEMDLHHYLNRIEKLSISI